MTIWLAIQGPRGRMAFAAELGWQDVEALCASLGMAVEYVRDGEGRCVGMRPFTPPPVADTADWLAEADWHEGG